MINRAPDASAAQSADRAEAIRARFEPSLPQLDHWPGRIAARLWQIADTLSAPADKDKRLCCTPAPN
jgi:hypothetical protein